MAIKGVQLEEYPLPFPQKGISVPLYMLRTRAIPCKHIHHSVKVGRCPNQVKYFFSTSLIKQ
jgi:hypothetical protein